MADIIVALIVFAIIFISITTQKWAFAVIMGLVAVILFMPTSDGIFYTCIFENIRFLFAKKRYTNTAKSPKEHIDTLVALKEIKDNGLLVYNGGAYGRVIKVGQKNFGIEDITEQNIDINYLANALKLLDGTQSADIVKIDRPVTLDKFSGDLFKKIAAVQDGFEERAVKEIKSAILQECIDRIDKLVHIGLSLICGGCF